MDGSSGQESGRDGQRNVDPRNRYLGKMSIYPGSTSPLWTPVHHISFGIHLVNWEIMVYTEQMRTKEGSTQMIDIIFHHVRLNIVPYPGGLRRDL